LAVSTLEERNEALAREKEAVEIQLKKIQKEFNTTKVNLGNTEQKLKGLVSMEKKCEELFDEIKKEKQRWDHINSEACEEREGLEKELRSLQSERNQLSFKIETI
jgi:chromosome segregation ATPase